MCCSWFPKERGDALGIIGREQMLHFPLFKRNTSVGKMKYCSCTIGLPIISRATAAIGKQQVEIRRWLFQKKED
jgi:hypothetical protein